MNKQGAEKIIKTFFNRKTKKTLTPIKSPAWVQLGILKSGICEERASGAIISIIKGYIKASPINSKKPAIKDSPIKPQRLKYLPLP